MTRKEEIKQEAEFMLMHGEVKETEDFIKGAEWADRTMLEKACGWLDNHILDYVYVKEYGQGIGVEEELFEDFKRAMEEQI